MSSPTTRKPVSRYRALYTRLPPSVQLIGMQLWLPVIFILMFCLCYIVAFHAPRIDAAPVGLVAPVATQIETTLQVATGRAVAYRTFASAEKAETAVRGGAVIAALVYPTQANGAATLYVASAHQYQSANLAKTLLQPVIAAQGMRLAVTDLAPLPAWDSFGMTAMYLMLAWCIGGYMVAMFIGLTGAPLRHWVRVAIILGGAIVLSLLANVLAGPVIGAIHGHFWLLVGIAIGWIFAIGLAVNGLSYFFGRFIALPSLVIFVFLSIPASGAALPTWMLPPFFQALQPYVVGYGITEMIKRTLYGVGEPYVFGSVQMACYAAAGALLMAVGRPWRQRREVRRILSGRSTMFADASRANAERGQRMREKVLARYGVVTPTDVAAMQAEDATVGDPFVNYGRSLSAMQNDTPEAQNGHDPEAK